MYKPLTMSMKIINLSLYLDVIRSSVCEIPGHEHPRGECCDPLMQMSIDNKLLSTLDILEKKEPLKILFGDYPKMEDFLQPTEEEFIIATHFYCDCNIIKLCTNYKFENRQREKLFQVLAQIFLKNHQYTLVFPMDLIKYGSDEDIDFFMMIGIKPDYNAYPYYGKRNDRSSNQKLNLFRKIHSKFSIEFPPNAIDLCYSYSHDIYEIMAFMGFFYAHGVEITSLEFEKSFIHHGIKMFPFLKSLGVSVHIENIKNIMESDKHTNQNKYLAIQWFRNNYHVGSHIPTRHNIHKHMSC